LLQKGAKAEDKLELLNTVTKLEGRYKIRLFRALLVYDALKSTINLLIFAGLMAQKNSGAS